MNVDSSYLQYINSLMNDDGFEVPAAGHRRFSIGSQFSDHGSDLINVDECKLVCQHSSMCFDYIYVIF